MEVSQIAKELLDLIGDPREFRKKAADEQWNQQVEELLYQIKETCERLLECPLSIPQGDLGRNYFDAFNHLKRIIKDFKNWQPPRNWQLTQIDAHIQNNFNAISGHWKKLNEGFHSFAAPCLFSEEVNRILNQTAKETEERLKQLKELLTQAQSEVEAIKSSEPRQLPSGVWLSMRKSSRNKQKDTVGRPGGG